MATRTASPGHRAPVEVFDLDSEATHQRLRISVAPGQDGAPALYVLDPLFLFDLAHGAAALLRVAARLTDGPFPDLTVVGVGYPTDDPADVFARRACDLTPSSGEATTAVALPPLTFGGADRFRSSIVNEVLPSVESRLPVDPDRRALVGFSFGGLFTLDVLLHQPEAFSGYLVGSPSLWWDDGLAFQWEQAWARDHDDLDVRAFMWVGTNEQLVGDSWKNERFPLDALQRLHQVDNVRELARRLRTRGYPNLRLTTSLLDGEYHLTAPAAGITRGLLAIFEGDDPVARQAQPTAADPDRVPRRVTSRGSSPP